MVGRTDARAEKSNLSTAACAAGLHTQAGWEAETVREFEQHVAWVLGCYGFATIVLGAHEDLVAEQKESNGQASTCLHIILFGSWRFWAAARSTYPRKKIILSW